MMNPEELKVGVIFIVEESDVYVSTISLCLTDSKTIDFYEGEYERTYDNREFSDYPSSLLKASTILK